MSGGVNLGLGDIINSIFGKKSQEKDDNEPVVETINTNLVKINAAAFEQEVMGSSIPVIVDCYTKSCPPCKKMGPMFEALAPEYEGKCKFIKVDLKESPSIGRQFKILGVPTLLLFKDGEKVNSLVGLVPEDKIKAEIDAIL